MARVSKEDNRAYQRKWYKKNQKKQIERNNGIRKEKTEWVKNYKSGKKCSRCSENHPATLDFHHIDPTTKIESPYLLARRSVSLAKIIEEVEKCELLCANCHRKHHWDEKELVVSV